jgi:hypothetical protein
MSLNASLHEEVDQLWTRDRADDVGVGGLYHQLFQQIAEQGDADFEVNVPRQSGAAIVGLQGECRGGADHSQILAGEESRWGTHWV